MSDTKYNSHDLFPPGGLFQKSQKCENLPEPVIASSHLQRQFLLSSSIYFFVSSKLNTGIEWIMHFSSAKSTFSTQPITFEYHEKSNFFTPAIILRWLSCADLFSELKKPLSAQWCWPSDVYSELARPTGIWPSCQSKTKINSWTRTKLRARQHRRRLNVTGGATNVGSPVDSTVSMSKVWFSQRPPQFRASKLTVS